LTPQAPPPQQQLPDESSDALTDLPEAELIAAMGTDINFL